MQPSSTLACHPATVKHAHQRCACIHIGLYENICNMITAGSPCSATCGRRADTSLATPAQQSMAFRGICTSFSLQRSFSTCVSLHAVHHSLAMVHHSLVKHSLVHHFLPSIMCAAAASEKSYPAPHHTLAPLPPFHPPPHWRMHIRAMHHYATHCIEHQWPISSLSFPSIIVSPRGITYAQVLLVQGRHSRVTGDLDIPGVARGGQHQPEGHHSQCQWPDAATFPLPHWVRPAFTGLQSPLRAFDKHVCA